MKKRILKGKTFGKLKVLKEDSKNTKRVKWICLCECGNTTSVYSYSLTTGNTKSCGCLSKKKPTHAHTVRGNISTEYSTWNAMVNRCTNPNRDNYKYYGGRGISVCDRWLTFANFIEDMGNKPNKSFSIERLDNNGNYEPNNCVWADKTTQSINQSIRVDNKTGVKGVTKRENGRYRARLRYNKKEIDLGTYIKKEDAIKARKEAENKYFKHTL